MPTPEFTIASVCERDLDLLLMEELVASSAFARWFAARGAGSSPLWMKGNRAPLLGTVESDHLATSGEGQSPGSSTRSAPAYTHTRTGFLATTSEGLMPRLVNAAATFSTIIWGFILDLMSRS